MVSLGKSTLNETTAGLFDKSVVVEIITYALHSTRSYTNLINLIEVRTTFLYEFPHLNVEPTLTR